MILKPLITHIDVRVLPGNTPKLAPAKRLPAKLDLFSCFYCGCTFPCWLYRAAITEAWIKVTDEDEVEWDHVIPKSRNGADSKENRVPCCAQCNRAKSQLTMEEFRQKLSTRQNKTIVFYGEKYGQC